MSVDSGDLHFDGEHREDDHTDYDINHSDSHGGSGANGQRAYTERSLSPFTATKGHDSSNKDSSSNINSAGGEEELVTAR